MKPYIASAVVAALSLPAAAQQVKPNPVDPAAAVPPASYESAFAGYTAYRDQELTPWRAANEEVATAGGHAGIFRGHGTRAPGKPAAKPPAAETPIKPDAAPTSKSSANPAGQAHGGHR